MDSNELNELKEKINIEKERKRQEQLEKEREKEREKQENLAKKLEEEKKSEFYNALVRIYQADTSPTDEIAIYQSKDGDYYLEQRNKEDSIDLYGHDEKKITVEQAIELGGKDIELLLTINNIENNGTLLRDANIKNYTSGNFPDEWDYEVYECDNKYYYIERLYTPVDWCEPMSGWCIRKDIAPKVREVSKEEVEANLGVSAEELKIASEIWNNGKEIKMSNDNPFRINTIRTIDGQYAKYDSNRTLRLISEEEVQKMTKENPQKNSKITLSSIAENVRNYIKNMGR